MTQQATNLPGRGAAKPIPELGGTTTTESDSGLKQAAGNTAIGDASAPGQDGMKTGISVYIEGLGDISEINESDIKQEENPNEGEGPYMVVLADMVSGPNGTAFAKGAVRRASKLISHFGDDEKKAEARASAKRLFDTKSVRMAMSHEEGKGQVAITSNYQTSDLNTLAEENARLNRETQTLRAALKEAQDAQNAASPQRGGQASTEGLPDFPTP
jgi:ribosomal protein L10